MFQRTEIICTKKNETCINNKSLWNRGFRMLERKTGLGPATPTLARLCSTNWAISAKNVKRRRLELPRRNWHYPLKVARLPIPPPLRLYFTYKNHLLSNSCVVKKILCPEQDSNLHASRHTHLKRARLPFRHLGILCNTLVTTHNILFMWAENETRTRDPNLGKVMLYQLSYFRRAFCRLVC